MACPGQKKEQRFIPVVGEGFLLRYNSKLPIVVYAPKDVEVRYRIWSASEKVESGQRINAAHEKPPTGGFSLRRRQPGTRPMFRPESTVIR